MSLNTFPEEWQSPISTPQLGAAAQFGADSQLFVKFYTYKEEIYSRSEKAGYKVFEDKEYITIQRPGDKFAIVRREATSYDKMRFPMQYEAYKKGDSKQLGIPLAAWNVPGLSEGELAVFKAYGIEYVHQVAQMNEVQAQSLGNNAKYLINRAKIEIADNNQREENAKLQAMLDEQTKKHQEELKAMENRLLSLMATKSSEAKQVEEKTGKKKTGFLED